MSARRVAVFAAALGLLAGFVLALVLPRERAADTQAPAATVGSARKPPPERRPGEPRFEVLRGSVRVALRVGDPEGRAAWAVRLVESRAVLDRVGRPPRRTAWARCAQLGRIVAGRFGWITQARGFTAVAPEESAEIPQTCQSRRVLSRRSAASSLVTVTRTDDRGQVVPARTVAFGRLGPRARAVELRDRSTPIHGRRQGDAFLIFARADPGIRDLRLRVGFDRGADLDRDLSGILDASELPRVVRRFQSTPQRATERVVARAPDPAGAAPYGIVAARSSRPGQWCPGQSTRIVGRRGGFLDNRLELFRVGLSGFFCGDDRYPLTRRRPVELQISSSGAQPGQEAASGRIERRSLPGSTVLSGRARREVRSLEVVTSRDLRTLVPDRLTGAFITAYDGNLPGEDVVVTATLADGTRRTSTLETGF